MPRLDASSLRRALFVALGLVFLAQGLGKLVDPTAYMLALTTFRVIAPVTLTPLSLAAVTLAWTALEIAVAVVMLKGALSRRPRARHTLATALVGLGIMAAYFSLELGALARGLEVPSTTSLGGLVHVPLSLATLVLQACVALALAHALRSAPAELVARRALA
jgi:hypothetical protein